MANRVDITAAVLNFLFPCVSAHNKMSNGHTKAHRRKQQQLKSARVWWCYQAACRAVISRRKLHSHTAARSDTRGTRAQITAQCHPRQKHLCEQTASPLQTGIRRSRSRSSV
ncbi:hypothetical protein QQF64_018250 [Cirrhinus molitorella]|uniref:Secreted protein n=1 Tax=Cirrhinus molitorella TaxID=172907 RepID=A0ABR3LPK6_9TELE